MTTAWERFRQTAAHGNVVLNFTAYPKTELGIYALAYRNAADNLVEVIKKRKWYSDIDACPIVFLYRHSIELYLKAIILWGSGLVRLQSGEHISTNRLFATHRFRELLPAVRRIFKEAGWLGDAAMGKQFRTFGEIEKLILEFEQIDPISFSFRYPINKSGNASLPDSFHFNVIALGEETGEMLKMLDGAATGVYEMFQTIASIHRDIPIDRW